MDIGWQFEKLSNIQSQIAKLSIGGAAKAPTSPASPGPPPGDEGVAGDNAEIVFKQLKSFYSSQLAVFNDSTDPLLTTSGGLNYSSPASLQRILSIYGGKSSYGKKDPKNEVMRESLEASEGLRILQADHDVHVIDRMRTEGYASSASTAQRLQQKGSPRFIRDLHPTPTLLRTKRNKRCRTCRHILVKPEPKVQTTRFRIRLLAQNYIPTISLTPLQPAPPLNAPPISLDALPALRPTQFLLTLKNPLFDAVKITLATPPQTPGKHGHRVTVLCPEFSIGPSVDQWDEALGDPKNRRSSRLIPGSFAKPEYVGGEGGKVAEAGKVWEKGRSWTSVVVEVVCAEIGQKRMKKPKTQSYSDDEESEGEDDGEDEEVLEIPIFVRMEWEGDVGVDGKDVPQGPESVEKRELAYWAVIGVGRVAGLEDPSRTK